MEKFVITVARETGNISIEGNAADLLNDPRVKKAYLGQ